MERKKIIWILISVGLFLAICIVAAILILDPRGQDPDGPASFFGKASPRAGAQEYLGLPSPSPSPGLLIDGDQLLVIGLPSAAPAASTSALPQGDRIVIDVLPGSSPIAPLGSPAISPASPAPAAQPAVSPRPSLSTKPAVRVSPKAPAPKASPALAKVTEYWIQTASFSSAGKAEEQRAFLSQQGLNAVVSTKEVNGKTYFRVRLGPYSTKREAEGWLTRISSLAGCSGAYVSESVAQRSR